MNMKYFTLIILIYFFIKGKRKASMGIVKGMFGFLKDIKNEKLLQRIIKERKKINQNKKVSDAELYKYGVISTIREKIEYGKRLFDKTKES